MSQNKDDKQKTLEDLNVEQLLEAIKELPETEKHKNAHTPQFAQAFKVLQTLGIEPGENKVLGNLLFRLIKIYRHEALNKNTFKHLCDVYYTTEKITEGDWHVYLNVTSVKVKELIKEYIYIRKRRVSDVSPQTLTRYQTFLQKHQIAPGRDFIEVNYLYELFLKGIHIKNRVVGLDYFTNLLHLSFTIKKLGFNTLWVGIDRTTTKIDPRNIVAWRKKQKRIYGKHYKEKPFEKQEEGSIPENISDQELVELAEKEEK